ncbi:unnamed protein product [Oppiella nova]|uniref:Uncharacterized protein n=1 Tax=Oppiella nova TaxID=334625 RepID=A0A7R9M401_9ACAR|nr:unnamed protein product [Oppiella nova]CAG2170258.1 unnamed protein product [Oppiella nova]
MAKKASFADLLYLALIVSVLRSDDPIEDNHVFSGQLVGSAVDDLGPTTAVNIYLHNLRNSYSLDTNVYTSSAKANVLYEETIDMIREVNSLGRYSRESRFHNSPVFAYLVSRGEQTVDNGLTAAIASTSSSALSSQTQHLDSELSSNESNDSSSVTSSPTSPTHPQPQPQEDDDESTCLAISLSELEVNESLVNEVLKSDCIYGESDDREDDGFVENNLLSDLDDAFINTGSSTDGLVSCDEMLPILDPLDDGVDSLFDELERLLAPEDSDILQSMNTV